MPTGTDYVRLVGKTGSVRPAAEPALPTRSRHLHHAPTAKAELLSPLSVLLSANYGVPPYISLSRLCAKARIGGMSILPPMISIYAPVLLPRAAFIASSSSPSVVTRAVCQSAHPSAFGNSA